MTNLSTNVIEYSATELAPKSDERTIFFYWCKKRCPLPFTDRLVWSYLVKCDEARGSGASQSAIAKFVGLDRQTVSRSLNRLLEHSLVARIHSRSWRAVEPAKDKHGGWFAPRTHDADTAHWGDKMAYWPVTLADDHKPFDDVLLALLRTLKGDKPAVNWESYESLSIPMGCNWRTVKSALKKRLPVEVFAGTKNRYGKVDRFDILLRDDPIKQQEKRPTVPPRRKKKEQEVQTVIPESSQVALPESSPPATTNVTQALPPSIWSPANDANIDRLRAVDSEVKEVLRNAGFKEYQIGKVLWALDKATTDGDTARGRRLFYAVFKKSTTPERVVAELLKNAEMRRRAQRQESAELIRLEEMSRCVAV